MIRPEKIIAELAARQDEALDLWAELDENGLFPGENEDKTAFINRCRSIFDFYRRMECELRENGAAVSAFGYEPPFFRNETIEVPGRHTLYLGYEKTDGEANPRLYPQLTGKEQRGDVTVFRFRFRERGVYRLTFQQQNHTTAETAVLEREMRVGTEANPTSGDSSPTTVQRHR